MSERIFVEKLYETLKSMLNEGKFTWLKKVYRHRNLARAIWIEWWKGATPPRTEVDLILIFEDPIQLNDKALIGCLEIEYFTPNDIKRKNFYAGLQQVMAFSVFGFDGLSLWHVFAPEVREDIILNFTNTMDELLKGFKLPVVYLAAKLEKEEKLILRSFSPWQNIVRNAEYFIECLNNFWMNREWRNTLLQDSKIRDRRSVIKILLKVPI